MVGLHLGSRLTSIHGVNLLIKIFEQGAWLLQATLFNRPRTGFNVMAASDAVGMGLNLNIRWAALAHPCILAMHKFSTGCFGDITTDSGGEKLGHDMSRALCYSACNTSLQWGAFLERTPTVEEGDSLEDKAGCALGRSDGPQLTADVKPSEG